MSAKWTDKQLEVIETRNKNILVSAAAGSGKTTVLVERIKRLIIDESISVDGILVVTFTNAAAGDMKEKIIKAIQKAVLEKGADVKFLRNQLDKVHMANISTFHSFAISVIRRYFYVTDVDPDFKICDDAEKAILQSDALDELLEEKFESNCEQFLDFIKMYCSVKSEKKARDMIVDLYEKIQSLPNPYEWLLSNVEMVRDMDGELPKQLKELIMKNVIEKLNKTVHAFANVAGMLKEKELNGLLAKSLADTELVNDILESAKNKDFENIAEKISTVKFATFAPKSEEKEIYGEIKAQVSDIRDAGKKHVNELKAEYFSFSSSENATLTEGMAKKLNTLTSLVVEFAERFKQKKEEKMLLDFSDIEHYALKILKNPEIAEEYKKKFNYIFVDEYQDSNMIQEAIVNCIKGDTNVFMVGDVKQSIYKFRLAEPEIFINKYELYKEATSGKDKKIDLNTNFRCKTHIINAVNDICSTIMPYDEDAELKKGVTYEGELDYKVQLHLVETKESELGAESSDAGIDSEISEMKAIELEARVTIALIKDALKEKIHEASNDKGQKDIERFIQLKDIVILMRAVKSSGDKYYQLLMDSGIPAFIDDSGGYFDTLEIEVFMNLLKVIDNKRRDIPLISVLHSKIMDFSADELAVIRIANRTVSYYEAFERYGNYGENAELKEKCKNAYEKIEEWRLLAQVMPLDEFVWKLMWQTGYYIYAGALPAGEQRQTNLRALADKTLKYANKRHDGLYGFIKYAEILKSKDVQVGQARLVSEGDNVVRIMTIHKSKGLEFPVVILSGLGKRFMAGRENSDVRMHKDIGLALPLYVGREKTPQKTIMQSIIESKNKSESMDEEARVLYVALTRAKDKLILVGSIKDAEKLREQYEFPGGRTPMRYLDMIIPVFLRKGMSYEIHTRNSIVVQEHKSNTFKDEFKKKFEQASTPGEPDEFVKSRLAYEYPDKDALTAKSKYSVSELGREKLSAYKSKAAVPIFLQGKKKLSGAEIGTALHTVMEKMDFKMAHKLFEQSDEKGYDYIKELVKKLKESVIIMPDAAEEINLKRLEKFIKSSIGKRAAQSDKIYKEAPFNIIKEINGIDTIVQGVIDCYFEENGEYVLIDYKSSYISGSEDIEALKEMYAGQVAVYSEALEITKNIKVKEKYLYFFSSDEAVQLT